MPTIFTVFVQVSHPNALCCYYEQCYSIFTWEDSVSCQLSYSTNQEEQKPLMLERPGGVLPGDKTAEKQAYLGRNADNKRSKCMIETQELDTNVRFIYLAGHVSESCCSRIGYKMIPRRLLNQASQLFVALNYGRNQYMVIEPLGAVPGSSIAGTNDATTEEQGRRRKRLNMTIFHFHNREVTWRSQERVITSAQSIPSAAGCLFV